MHIITTNNEFSMHINAPNNESLMHIYTTNKDCLAHRQASYIYHRCRNGPSFTVGGINGPFLA
jgi:hypothetical protein